MGVRVRRPATIHNIILSTLLHATISLLNCTIIISVIIYDVLEDLVVLVHSFIRPRMTDKAERRARAIAVTIQIVSATAAR